MLIVSKIIRIQIYYSPSKNFFVAEMLDISVGPKVVDSIKGINTSLPSNFFTILQAQTPQRTKTDVGKNSLV